MPYANEPSKKLPKVESGPAAGGQPVKPDVEERLAELERRLAHLEHLSLISNVRTETRT